MGRHGQKTPMNESAKEKECLLRPVSRKHRSEIRALTKKLLSITVVPNAFKNQSTWESHLEIDTILRRLKEIEPEMRPRNREEHFEDLLSWVKNNGGNVENVTITRYDNMEYGLAATKDLEEGDLICSVPSKLTLRVDLIENSILKDLAANDRILKEMDNVRLVLLLIAEYVKGPASFWYPYIASLPLKYNTVLYFTTEDFLAFKHSPVFERSLNLCSIVARQYSYFHQIFQDSKDEASQKLRNFFTYDLYRWAVSTIITRQNILPSGTNLVNSLIPLWDMCNHAQGYLSSFSMESENICTAFKPFKKGEQIFIHYGDRSSEDFFLHNGFVNEGDNESYLLMLGISKQDVLYAQRAEVLEHHHLSKVSVFRIRKNEDPMTAELETFLTVVNMDGDQLRECLKDPKKVLPKGPEVEYNNYKYLNTRLSIMLMAYNVKKKKEEEESSSSLTDIQRSVRALLELEKRCIVSALKITQEKLDELKTVEKEKPVQTNTPEKEDEKK